MNLSILVSLGFAPSRLSGKFEGDLFYFAGVEWVPSLSFPRF